jgi:hypothetical protein
MVAKNVTEVKEMAKRTVKVDYDINNDGVVDENDTIEVAVSEPKVFGWVAGRRANQQIHPETNPYKGS